MVDERVAVDVLLRSRAEESVELGARALARQGHRDLVAGEPPAERKDVGRGVSVGRVRDRELPDVERPGAFELKLDVMQPGALRERDVRSGVREGRTVRAEVSLDDGRGRVFFECEETPRMHHSGRFRGARRRCDMEDEERFFEMGAGRHVQDRAVIEKRIAERAKEVLRRVSLRCARDEGALDALRRFRQNVLQALEENRGGEIARRPPEKTPVHEHDPGFRRRESQRSETRLQFERRGPLCEGDFVGRRREGGPGQGRQVREAPVLVVRRREAESLELRQGGRPQLLQPGRARPPRREFPGARGERGDPLTKGRRRSGTRHRAPVPAATGAVWPASFSIQE